MFEHVEPFAGDPILSLNEDFQKDPRPHKINLSIGIYFDDAGRIPVLESVRRAETMVVARDAAKPYLPIEGAANFREQVQSLLFGAGHAALAGKRVATIQSVGSSGGLKVGADFIARWLPGSAVWVSDPSWENHRSMFEGAGLAVHSYPYYDSGTGALSFEAMGDAVRKLPARSVVLIHACPLDEVDLQILTSMQDNARISNVDLAKELGMAPSAVLERVKKLEQRKVILQYNTVIDPIAVNQKLLAFIFIKSKEGFTCSTQTASALAKIPEVQEVHHIAGEDCFLGESENGRFCIVDDTHAQFIEENT